MILKVEKIEFLNFYISLTSEAFDFVSNDLSSSTLSYSYPYMTRIKLRKSNFQNNLVTSSTIENLFLSANSYGFQLDLNFDSNYIVDSVFM